MNENVLKEVSSLLFKKKEISNGFIFSTVFILAGAVVSYITLNDAGAIVGAMIGASMFGAAITKLNQNKKILSVLQNLDDAL